MITVRAADAADAQAIADVQAASWRLASRSSFDPAVLDRLSVDEHRLVAERAGRVVGFATYGPADDDDLPGSVGELRGLYVHPEARGDGVGRALTDAALEALHAAGYGEAVVWVLDANRHARGFYERAGFVAEAGGVPFSDLGVTQTRYRRRL
jgi:ribosomal protein S18 acetylase RimI-like enzyme